MVLYFTGTGNSYDIGKKIAKALGEELVSIAKLVKEGTYTLSLKEGENIGFVYPVHAFAPPDIVTGFIKNMKLSNYNGNYMYSVLNCAGTEEYTHRIIKETAKKAGYNIGGFYKILMPGNYVIGKNQLPEEVYKGYLESEDSEINKVVKSIKRKEENYKKEHHSYLFSYVVHKLAALEKSTEFTVGDNCIGCGRCERVCSMGAITMENGRLIRNKKNCAFCLGCVNACKTEALQIGKKTIGNPRYIHPDYKI